MNTIWILLLLSGDHTTIVERFLYEADCHRQGSEGASRGSGAVRANYQPGAQDCAEGDRVTLATKTHPFNMTATEMVTMTALTETGSTKLAARQLGRSPKTIEVHVNAARKKMGHSTPMQAALAWDRLIRGNE
jgi:DNA-binding NarL/FixJ family response regulator